jgi:hypothetical protein
VFPPAGSQIYRNEAGEPTGWSAPEDSSTYYHDVCGMQHSDGQCPEDGDENYDDDALDAWADANEEEEDLAGMNERDAVIDQDHRFEEKGVNGYEL